MSPLQIEIMLHYHCQSGDHELFRSNKSAWSRFGEDLVRADLLRKADPHEGREEKFTITPKGRAYIEKLCSIPPPKEKIIYVFEEPKKDA